MTGGRRDTGKQPMEGRDKGKRPASDIFKKASATNKQNRASDCGGHGYVVHSGGSITHLVHRDRLRAKLGREPSLAKGFLHTHSRLNSEGLREFSSSSVRSRHDAFVEMHEPSSSEGSTTTPLPSLSIQIERWSEMVGGKKKGRISGLVGLAHSRATYTRSTDTEPTQRERDLEAEVTSLKAAVADLRTEVSQLRAEMAKVDEQLATIQQFMMTQMQMQQTAATRTRSVLPPAPHLPVPSTSRRDQGTHTSSSIRLPFGLGPLDPNVDDYMSDDDNINK